MVAALPGADERAYPAGPAPAVVVDAAPPGPAVDLSRGAPHVRAGEPEGWHCGDAAFAAAHRRLPDGRRPGAAAHRRAGRARARLAGHYADLPDAARRRGDPAGAGSPRRA